MDKNKHLDSVISTHQITKEETLFDKYVKKKNEVKEALEENYGSNNYSYPGNYNPNLEYNTPLPKTTYNYYNGNSSGLVAITERTVLM